MKRLLLLALVALASCAPETAQERLARQLRRYDHAELATRSQFGDKWPFGPDTVIVHCEKQIYYLVSTLDGRTYALNGTAKSTQKYKDIEEIWLPDKSMGGNWKINIGPILDIANKNCNK
jgi:hypothetical protein